VGNRGRRVNVEGSVVVRRALITVVLAAIVAALLLFVNSAKGPVSTTATQLRTVNAELVAAQRRLETAAAARDVALAQAQAAQARLAQRSIERDAASSRYQAIERQLHHQQNSLTATTTDLTQRFTRLGYLNQCLAGASKALNQAAVADYAGLAATLESVKVQCIAARGGAA
jgi:hypothetical protein